jgi:hypothetical protein
MVEENFQITQNRVFRYGLLLTWIPLLCFIVPAAIGVTRAITQASSAKATGFGVIAAGVTEVAATFGLAVIVASEAVGIVMLVRTSSRNDLIRTVVTVVSVVCSGLLLLVLGLFLWFAILHHWG